MGINGRRNGAAGLVTCVKSSLPLFIMCAVDPYLPLSTTDLDIVAKVRSNSFPWRGQFSPQLVERLLQMYCPPDAEVLDPFGGSGTVLHECVVSNRNASITEVNPAAWILSRTYGLANLTSSQRIRAIESVEQYILSESPVRECIEGNVPASEGLIDETVREFCSRSFNDIEKIIFTSWVVLLDIKNRVTSADRITKIFGHLTRTIVSLPHTSVRTRAFLSDARKMPFLESTFDFTITSPPYINVFNYHQNYRASVELFGWNLLKVAKSEIGSNRANRGNRFITVAEYCIDMGKVLEEVHRVTRSNGRVIMVVGRESSVLGVSWMNSDIVRRLAVESGLYECSLVQERKFKNKFGTIIYEDVLHLKPNSSSFQTTGLAQIVARELFREAMTTASRGNVVLLERAIHKTYELTGSPILDLIDTPHTLSN